ncbi:hypothetical protein H2200_005843 [Cladophialophora chaetospira]|uniref:Uncharacterized protein n=1 Tax=Cladophialophora chaetospira TaxID=386627 RepID=A0AA38XA08_9EURO|nr:hypothetical protein H2200_005843 [Cladophialophora chaetospira]
MAPSDPNTTPSAAMAEKDLSSTLGPAYEGKNSQLKELTWSTSTADPPIPSSITLPADSSSSSKFEGLKALAKEVASSIPALASSAAKLRELRVEIQAELAIARTVAPSPSTDTLPHLNGDMRSTVRLTTTAVEEYQAILLKLDPLLAISKEKEMICCRILVNVPSFEMTCQALDSSFCESIRTLRNHLQARLELAKEQQTIDQMMLDALESGGSNLPG